MYGFTSPDWSYFLMPGCKVLVVGYYGFGNAGDEAILDRVLAELRRTLPDPAFTVVCGNPAGIATRYGVDALLWAEAESIQRGVQGCDVVVAGGGGLFHDYWGVNPERLFLDANGGIGLYLSVALWAALYRKPLVLYGVGVGPLFSETGRECLRTICGVATSIAVRDSLSRELLLSIGIARDKILLGADCVWTADAAPSVPPPGPGAQPRIAVVPRFWSFAVDPSYWEGQLASALDEIVDELGARIVFVPFQNASHERENDAAVAQRIRAMVKRPEQFEIASQGGSFQKIQQLLAGCDLVVGMRFHSLVFAALAGVPIVALDYDPKVADLMTELGLEEFDIPVDRLTADAVLHTTRRALEARSEIRLKFAGARDTLRERARSMAALVEAALAGRGSMPELGVREREQLATAIRRQIRELESIKSTLSEKLAGASAEVVPLKNRIAELERVTVALEQQKDEAVERLESHAVQFAEARVKLAGATAENAELLRRLQTAAADRARIAELDQSTTRQERRIAELVEWSEKQRGQIGVLTSRVEELLRELNVAYRSRDELAEKLAARGIVPALRRLVQAMLDVIQKITPEFLRRAVRPVYLPIYRKLIQPARPRRLPPSPVRPVAVAPGAPIETQNAAAAQGPGILPPHESGKAVAPPSSASHSGFQPKISVILPVWNHAELLEDSIRSVMTQTYTNFELIVVDDGSTTDLVPVVSRFASDPRLRYIRRPHQGLPQTLSGGFRMAAGEYFTWTSADNLMHPNTLATLLEFLLRRPDLEMTYGDMDLIDHAGRPASHSDYRVTAQRPWATHQLSLPRTIATLGLVNDNFIGGCFLYRAAIGRALGDYDSSLLGTEDYDYWLRLSAISRIEHVDTDECLYSYRVHDDSLSGRHAPQIAKNAEALIEYHRERMEFYRAPFHVLVLAAEADPLLSRNAVVMAASLEARGHRVVTARDAEDEAAREFAAIPADKRMVLACGAVSRMPASGQFVFFWSAQGLPAEPDSRLTWHLCESAGDAAALPAAGVLNHSLLPLSRLDFRSELLLALKARDNCWPLWDLPVFDEPLVLYLGPLCEEFLDWGALERLLRSHPGATFLFISNDSEHVFNPATRLGNEHVRFLGHKQYREWHAYLSRAAVLLAPFRNAAGVERYLYDVLLTYVAAGKPILTTPDIHLAGFRDLPNAVVSDAGAFSGGLDAALRLRPDLQLADRYLQARSPEAVADRLLGIANTRLFHARTRHPNVAAEPKRPSCVIEVQSLDRGGLERVVYNQAVDLAANGYAVTIAATLRGGAIADECRAEGIPCRVVKNEEEFRALLRRESVDLLIRHYSFTGSKPAVAEGIPVLSFVHNSYLWTAPEEDRTIREADLGTTHYIAVSSSARRYFCRKYSVDPERVTVIPNGIDVARYEQASHATAAVTRSTLGLREDDFVLLSVASIIGTKAQAHAIAAVHALHDKYPNLTLILLGSPADANYYSFIRDLIRDYGLERAVLLTPPTDAVTDYYRLADAFLLSSITEGWSLAMTEAMYFGLPMILTDTGAAEVVSDNHLGIVVPPPYRDPLEVNAANLWDICTNRAPANLPALISAIEEFYTRRDYWKRQGTAGRAIVTSTFDSRLICARQRRLIESILIRHYGAGRFDFTGRAVAASLP